MKVTEILTEGMKAPAFKGKNELGKTISLDDFKGQKVVLYFYPQDDTPTCTVQACNLRDNYALLQKEGFTVVGVSPDDETKHKKFQTKHNLPFTLIADIKNEIIEKYDTIVIRDVIEHIEDKTTALANIFNLLKPGGKLFMSFPPKYCAYAGHQQTVPTLLGKLPYLHVLPNFIYKAYLNLISCPVKKINYLIW